MSFLGERTDLAYEYLFLAFHFSLERWKSENEKNWHEQTL